MIVIELEWHTDETRNRIGQLFSQPGMIISLISQEIGAKEKVAGCYRHQSEDGIGRHNSKDDTKIERFSSKASPTDEKTKSPADDDNMR